MIAPAHFLEHIIRPTLAGLPAAMGGRAAERLLLGTAIVESGLTWLVQHGGGPGRTFYQIEPGTWGDVRRYLDRDDRRHLRDKVMRISGRDDLAGELPALRGLVGNLYAATAFARVRYWYEPQALPGADDLPGLAAYWKEHYNSAAGAGKAAKFVAQFIKHAGDL